MDLSMAYVAYYPFTITDQIETITGDDTDEIPPLPTDVQNAINEATGMNELKKIAIVTVAKTDDKTLTVIFHDSDPLPEREYFFIIPNEGLSGSVIPE